MVCSRKGQRVVGVPVGIRRNGLVLAVRAPTRLRALDLLAGREVGLWDLAAGSRTRLILESSAIILMN
jgi:hypothetical protein